MAINGLGWIKSRDGWEVHPWGPWAKGYLVPKDRAQEKCAQLSTLRFVLFLLVIASFFLAYVLRSWWPVTICALVGTLGEILSIRWLFRTESRVNPLGFKKGMEHLLGWRLAYGVVRVLSIVALSLTIYALYLSPSLWEAYLLLVAIICLQFFLNYFESLQK